MRIFCPSRAKEPYRKAIGELSRRAKVDVVFARKLPELEDPVVFDEKGEPLTMELLKGFVESRRDFVVGGPDGTDLPGHRVSLGPYTMNHQIALIVLLDLLFRVRFPRHPYNKH
jgi:23S rRNA pseudoU1915 N3-methylase RlmH